MKTGQHANLAQLNFGEVAVKKVFEILLANSAKNIPCRIYNKDLHRFDIERDFKTKFQSDEVLVNENFKICDTRKENIKYIPDGLHQVDICFISAQQKNALPIEVKLGITGGSKRFPNTFIRYWKREGGIKYVEQDGQIRLIGNMIHLLDSTCIIRESMFIREGQIKLLPSWGLVVRQESIKHYHESQNSNMFNQLMYVFVFEELWGNLDVEERKEIQSTIKDLIDREFDILNLHTPAS